MPRPRCSANEECLIELAVTNCFSFAILKCCSFCGQKKWFAKKMVNCCGCKLSAHKKCVLDKLRELDEAAAANDEVTMTGDLILPRRHTVPNRRRKKHFFTVKESSRGGPKSRVTVFADNADSSRADGFSC